MANSSILAYIKQARSLNQTYDEIAENLKRTGWSHDEISQAFSEVSDTITPKPILPPPPQKTANSGMWMAFEHILLFISLYVMATSIALALHTFIDKWVLGVPTGGYSNTWGSWNKTLLRGYLSSLIVSYPLFSFLFLRITRKLILDSHLRSLRSRKILIYMTLIGTFIFLIYSIISTIYNLLGGNITTNFVLHFLVTGGISGIIFTYYLNEVKEDRKNV